MKSLQPLMNQLGYSFNDEQWLKQALTHRSLGAPHNERLEFLGDAILNFIAAQWLYRQFEGGTEGDLTRYRAALVRKETLAEIANELDLGPYLRLGIGELKSGGFRRPSMLADTVEAIIGALYLDGGLSPCQRWIESWLKTQCARFDEKKEKDPKTKLQEWLQAHEYPLPEYKLIKTTGKEHERIFFIQCEVKGFDFTTKGEALTCRKAEQKAAEAFIKKCKAD